MSDKCRSCGAPIIWAKTANGKAMPVDAEPVSDGNIEFHDGIAVYLAAGTHPSAMRYKSHFATCPNAKQHRKK